MKKVQIDECLDANGNITVRYWDGSPNGNTEAPVIATFYDESYAIEFVYQINNEAT